MVIDFSTIDVRERPVLVLKTLNGKVIQTLGYAFNLSAKLCYNEVSEINFDIPAQVNGTPVPNYENVVGMMLIDMVDYGQFELRNPKIENDGIKEIKRCQAYSLEYEFTRKLLTIEENTYNFWNPVAPSGTILGIILEEMPTWSVGEVDPELIGKYRTFEESSENIYNFMKSTLQETYNCIFDFDTYNRKINVRDASLSVATTPVYLSLDNLIKKITVEEETDNIVTVLNVNGAEGVDIRGVNPLGNNKIYNLDYFMNTTNFDEAIVLKWKDWKAAFAEKQFEYYQLSVEQALSTSKYLTENAKLTDLQGELQSLENLQSVYIQAATEGGGDHSEELKKVKLDIETKQGEIDTQEGLVNSILAESAVITEEMSAINKELSLEQKTDDDGNTYGWFASEEYAMIFPYFKEDSIEESSFVVSDVASYDVDGISNKIKNATFSYVSRVTIEDADGNQTDVDTGVLTKIASETKELFSATGGTLTIKYDEESATTELVERTFSAEVVRLSFEKDQDGKLVLSAYLSEGDGYDLSKKEAFEFESGTLSITGSIGDITHDTVPDADAPNSYSTGTSFSFAAVEDDTQNTQMYFTKNVSEFERRSTEWDLYEYGEDCLEKLAWPSYSFKIDSANFLTLDEFISFARQLKLGNKAYVDLDDGDVLSPILIGVTIDFESPDSLTLEFGDKYVANDSSFKLVDLLEKSVSMGSKVDMSKYTYSAFVDSGASTSVRDFMQSALDVTKNKILSSSGQAVSWDDSGLHLRKYAGESLSRANMYDPKQIRMVNNVIAFTDDNWENVAMAIGETADPSNPDGDPIYGVVAPSIVGTLLASENLVIESKKKDGNISVFKVDADGAILHNAKFDLVTDTSHILLDPKLGFGIGNYPVVREIEKDGVMTTVWADGSDNNGTKLEDNAKLWIDTEGNIHFKGKLEGADGKFTGSIEVGKTDNGKPMFQVDTDGNVTANSGTFKGVVNADDLQINGTSILKLDSAGNKTNKIGLSYLDLEGFESGIDEDDLFKILSDTESEKYGLFIAKGDDDESWLVLDADYINGNIWADQIVLFGDMEIFKDRKSNKDDNLGGHIGYTTTTLDNKAAGVHMIAVGSSGEVAVTANGAKLLYGSDDNQIFVTGGMIGLELNGVPVLTISSSTQTGTFSSAYTWKGLEAESTVAVFAE